jgi:glutamine synthetase
LRFITFVVNTLAAIYRHNGLLKASIMSAANAHRLGAAEAPPAIISSFLGSHLSSVLDHMETTDDVVKILSKRELRLNIPSIPELMIDNTDRNRTSPFAFTGNRFEFRAVGAEANCASAMIALNTAMAEQLTIFKREVDALIDKGHSKEDALVKIIRKYIKYSKPIRFDGNGYSDEWRKEAARRGLDGEASAPLVFDRYLDEESVAMFRNMDVMTETELVARNEIKWEMYTKKIQIEARVLGDLALNHIIPTATKYQSSLLDNVIKMEQVIGKEEGDRLSAENIELVKSMAEHVAEIRRLVAELIERRKVANRIASEREKAIAYHDTVAPMLEEIRSHIDNLELVVDNELWTLPKYRELLFIV